MLGKTSAGRAMNTGSRGIQSTMPSVGRVLPESTMRRIVFRDVLYEANVTVWLTRKRVWLARAAVLLMVGGFAFGFVSCLHLKSVTSSDLRHQYLLQRSEK